MYKYENTVYWSNEDEVFIAEVPALPGCMAQGGTQQAVLSNACDANELWLDTAKELDDPITEPKGQRLVYA